MRDIEKLWKRHKDVEEGVVQGEVSRNIARRTGMSESTINQIRNGRVIGELRDSGAGHKTLTGSRRKS